MLFLLAFFVWINDQIGEDLSHSRTFNKKDLRALFQKYNVTEQQALYCCIQRGQVTWKSSSRSDGWRNPHIFIYFEQLSHRHTLPDTEFILLTDDGTNSSQPLPVFAFSKHRNAKNVCLFPDFEMLWELIDPERNWIPICQQHAAQFPWKVKSPIGFFRGCDTGVEDRLRLTLFSYHNPDLVDATFNRVGKPEIRALLDSLEKEVSGASIEDHFRYKYLFDVDGNASTYSRCRWILLSNCLLLKMQSDYCQWYYKALKPFVHFVPIRRDLSDLVETLDFLKSHDDEARQIAEQGRGLALELFSCETVDRYVVTLLEEYANRSHRPERR
jgi:hypothetical protein